MKSKYHIFISYTQTDGDIAGSLASRLDEAGLKCFMADRSILAAAEWEPSLREALFASESVLLLMTPRSKDSLWVAAEAGAAWILQKNLIPVLMFVEPSQLFDPIRKYQARVAETPEQISALVTELCSVSAVSGCNSKLFGSRPKHYPPERHSESFTNPENWERLLKIGEWSLDSSSGSILGEGMYRYLLSQESFGRMPYTVRCVLSFLELRPEPPLCAVNAGIVLGWNVPLRSRQYLHLMFTGERLLLEKVGFRGGEEFLDFHHVNTGVPFKVEPNRRYEVIVRVSGKDIIVLCDQQEVYAVKLEGEIPSGRVGLRPWRSLVKCDCFDVAVDP